MYERYWGLNGSPFQGTSDLRWFVETAAHEEALARFSFLVEQRRRFGLLRGPVGTGKSLLLLAARRDAEQSGRDVVAVDLFGLDSHEMLWQLVIALRLGPKDGCSRWWLWQALTDHLQALTSARLPIVLLCDHLERAESDGLGLLERLLHLRAANDGCLTILAAARDTFDECLIPELTEQSDLRIDLPRLNRHESALFVGGLLDKARCDREVFEPAALKALFDLSGGEPRAITRLCDLALAAGAHQELDCIDEVTLRAVAGELPSVGRRRMPNFSLAGALT